MGSRQVIDIDTGNPFWLRCTDEWYRDWDAVWSAQCPHRGTEVRKRTSSAGRVSYWAQCLTCGHTPFGAIAKANIADPDRVPDHDPTLAKRFAEDRDRRCAAVNQKHVRLQKAEKAEWWRWYDRYLKTPDWLRKRDLVFARANGICEGCGVRPAEQVHHRTYDHVGNEFLFELVALCGACHDRIHDEKQEVAA
jgi:5-methylcytosine-specific restriction endonuclease McrA